jgi:hypothetical protein
MYNNDVGKRFMKVKRHSNERHPLFYFISFTTLGSPLTDIVIVHIVYINETRLHRIVEERAKEQEHKKAEEEVKAAELV